MPSDEADEPTDETDERTDETDEPTRSGPWVRRNRRVAYENPWVTVWHDDVDRPDGSPGIYGVVHFAAAAVGVVVIDDADRVLLVGQHRYALDAYSWEIPEGGVPPGESPLDGARRELREETGVEATDWREIVRFHLSNSITDEAGVLFAARAIRHGTATPDPTEELAVHWVPFAETVAMIGDGRITDAMTIMALQRLALERPPGGVGLPTARILRRVTTLHVLRVFVGPDGRGGNPLGVFLDGARISTERRQAVARELGFSETVFVDDPAEGAIRIFTPGRELPFAGHPTVGTAWLFRESGAPADVLRPPAGDVAFRHDAERTWIRADPAWVHEFDSRQLASPAAVDAFDGPALGEPGIHVWAWIDEPSGIVRVRYFPTDFLILEDEATGAAAVRLGAILGRPITIRQGVGSEILVRPQPDGTVEIGGRVEPVETREYSLPQ
jgi:predicted PhzF superfamily epimerase YddE/YHI9/8-oxo-dGTP pyrophosphatase MutT (NUDIX family)